MFLLKIQHKKNLTKNWIFKNILAHTISGTYIKTGKYFLYLAK